MVALEQGITLGQRGVAALSQGNAGEADQALGQATQSLAKALEMAKEDDVRNSIQANIRSVRTAQMQVTLRKHGATSREAAARYGAGCYAEAIQTYDWCWRWKRRP